MVAVVVCKQDSAYAFVVQPVVGHQFLYCLRGNTGIYKQPL